MGGGGLHRRAGTRGVRRSHMAYTCEDKRKKNIFILKNGSENAIELKYEINYGCFVNFQTITN